MLQFLPHHYPTPHGYVSFPVLPSSRSNAFYEVRRGLFVLFAVAICAVPWEPAPGRTPFCFPLAGFTAACTASPAAPPLAHPHAPTCALDRLPAWFIAATDCPTTRASHTTFFALPPHPTPYHYITPFNLGSPLLLAFRQLYTLVVVQTL